MVITALHVESLQFKPFNCQGNPEPLKNLVRDISWKFSSKLKYLEIFYNACALYLSHLQIAVVNYSRIWIKVLTFLQKAPP